MAKKRKKNNFIGYLAIMAVAVGIGVFWLAEQSKPVTKQAEIGEIKETVPVIETKPAPAGGDYAMAPLNSDLKKIVAQKLLDISSVYRDMIVPPGSPADYTRDLANQTVNDYSFAFDYQNSRYVVAADYSGGEHCCFDWHVFTLDSRNSLSEMAGDGAISQMGNVYPEGERNLVKKNGNLYLTLVDDRFAYYCGSYSGSPFINRYFLISGDKLVLKNGDFKDEFSKAAQEDEKELADYYSGPSQSAPADSGVLESRCRLLVERTANYLAAGENAKAWDGFEELYAKLSPMNPFKTALGRYAAAFEIKADIADAFKEP